MLTTQTFTFYVTFTNYLLLVSILLTDDTFTKVNTLFGNSYKIYLILKGFIGMNVGSESYYNETVVPNVDNAVDKVTKDFIMECRLSTPNPNRVRVIIDAGWSHSGWWARKCTVFGIDADTGLLLAVYHVIRGENFQGSSKSILKQFMIV